MNAKEKLYDFIENNIRPIFDAPNKIGLNLISLCQNDPTNDLIIHPMSTKGFCGVILFGNKVDTIILNEGRTDTERNFDLAHEIVHKYKHRNQTSLVCGCLNDTKNGFLEWEANEGAAELLLPYKHFIPRLMEVYNQLDGTFRIEKAKEILAKEYQVTPSIVELRIKNLKYEIQQYMDGVPVDKIKLMSQNQLRNNGVQVKSLIDLENEKLMEGIRQWHANRNR